MLMLTVILLALVPAIAILWPFLRRQGSSDLIEDESSLQAELARRWDAALAGLKSAELERAIGNLAEQDYRWLREQYMGEAAAVMKAMELEEQQEEELMARIEREIEEARRRVIGRDNSDGSTSCPHCRSALEAGSSSCPTCGHVIAKDGQGNEPAALIAERVPDE